MVRDWGEFAEFARGHFGKLRKNGGKGLRVLSGASSSPTLARMRRELLKQFPKAKWHEYEPIAWRNEERDDRGNVLWPGPDIAHAHVVVCLDADILGSHPATVRNARDFADGRKAGTDAMSRLYVAEAAYSITGAAADHRLALPRKDIAALARAIYHEVQGLVSGKPYKATANPFVRAAAKDVVSNFGESILIAGLGQPAEVHALVSKMNWSLATRVAFPSEQNSVATRFFYAEEIAALAADVNIGKVQTLLILGGNPVYDAPVDLGFSEAISKATMSIHLGPYRNETSRLCTWHVPQAHFLEAWGDSLSHDHDRGVYGVAQPMIEPLYGGKSAIEVLALILGTEAALSDALVRETFKQKYGPNFERKMAANASRRQTPIRAGRQPRPSGFRAGQLPSGRSAKRRTAEDSRAFHQERRVGNHLPPGRESLRRTLCQQWLAPGIARPDHLAHLGQCRNDEPGHGEGFGREERRCGQAEIRRA